VQSYILARLRLKKMNHCTNMPHLGVYTSFSYMERTLSQHSSGALLKIDEVTGDAKSAAFFPNAFAAVRRDAVGQKSIDYRIRN
jgi:hypothetical protein